MQRQRRFLAKKDRGGETRRGPVLWDGSPPAGRAGAEDQPVRGAQPSTVQYMKYL
jgi:hypothetical protein